MSAKAREILSRHPKDGLGSAIPSIERSIGRMAAAMKPRTTRSQDMRSEEERERDYDREM